jgi:hypothetical protein
MSNAKLWVYGGAAGIVGTCSYVTAIAVPWPETQLGTSMGLTVASMWPVLSIVYSYGLYDYVAAERPSVANRLGLMFAVAGFATVLAMLIVQIGVDAGMREISRTLEAREAMTLKRGLRLIDQGIDVAWDMLIGTALVFSGVAARQRRGLGPGWGIPLVILGVGLIALNIATFPWPPASRGLFDIGPLIGAFEIALATRLLMLGRRASAEGSLVR